MTATVPPLFGPEMLANPYARYAQLRGPVSWNEQLGLWLITRYEDVRWALGDPRLSSTLATPDDHPADGSAHLLADMYTFVRSSLVFTDSPDHYCLGAPLARLEGRIALQTVFERWPDIHQAGELVYADNFNVRLPRSLPVATS